MKTTNYVAAAALVVALGASVAGANSAQASNLRLEGGLGYDIGLSNLNANTTIGPATINFQSDGIGGGGLAANAALWWDGAFGQPQTFLGDLSIGAQYLHFTNDNQTTAGVTFGGGGGGGGSLNLGLDIDAVMANIAWRPSFGPVHPFFGVGGGVAFTNLTGKINILGSTASTHDSETAAAGQAFLGFDYDITQHAYFGLTGTFFYTDSSYNKFFPGINVDVAQSQMALMAHLGWKF